MINLIIEFLKTGLFAVGGGMATIPFLQNMAQNYDWFSSKELLDMIAVSEATPGAIGINCATFAGYRAYKILGAISASIALIIPATIIILIICRAMDKFKNSKIVKDMFETLRPSTAGLILGAMFEVMLMTLFDISKFEQTKKFISLIKPVEILIFISFFIIMQKYKKIHPLVFIGLGAVFGLIFKL